MHLVIVLLTVCMCMCVCRRYRNVLDIYLPISYHNGGSHSLAAPAKYPVVILVSGGAWIIGYKLWSSLVGRALSILNIITIVPDYRNFPQGNNSTVTVPRPDTGLCGVSVSVRAMCV